MRDEQDSTKRKLEKAATDYITACYGDKVSDAQRREIVQAFLSGIHWLNCELHYQQTAIGDATRDILFPDKYTWS